MPDEILPELSVTGSRPSGGFTYDLSNPYGNELADAFYEALRQFGAPEAQPLTVLPEVQVTPPKRQPLEGTLLLAGASAGDQPREEMALHEASRAFGLPTAAPLASEETLARQLGITVEQLRQPVTESPVKPRAPAPVAEVLPEARVTPRPSQLVRARMGSGMDIGFSILAEHLLLPWAFEKLGLKTRPDDPVAETVLEEARVTARPTVRSPRSPALDLLPELQVSAPAALDVLDVAMVEATRPQKRPSLSLGPSYGITRTPEQLVDPLVGSAPANRSGIRVPGALQGVAGQRVGNLTRTRRAPATRGAAGVPASLAVPFAPYLGLALADLAAPLTATGGSAGTITPVSTDTCNCSEKKKQKKKRKPRSVCYRGSYTETSKSLRKVRRESIPCT